MHFNKGSLRNHSNSRFAFLKPFSLLLVSNLPCLVVSVAVWLFTFVLCDSMLETLRTMFDLSVGGVNNLFCMIFVGFIHLSLLMMFLAVFKCF